MTNTMGIGPTGPAAPSGNGMQQATAGLPMDTALMPLASRIASQVASGQLTMPDNPQAWQQLINKYTNGNGGSGLAPDFGETISTTPASPGTPAPAGSPAPANANTADFLAAIKQHESGGDYTAYNAAGGASGAYQFIQSTWDSEANAAGYGQYAGKPAGEAPPQVQDAVASYMANNYYSEYGNWDDAAQAWYDPADVGKNVVPAPGAGNTETATGYGQQIVDMMNQNAAPETPAQLSGSPVIGASGNPIGAVAFAQSQLGVPYQWGGETTGKDFDCSGLVQAAYKAAGIDLPRTAQEQYDATTPLSAGVKMEPGDLLFFGQSTGAITHVGIYVGNGQMIDAPHTGADVRTENMNWADFVGATRPSDATGASAMVNGQPSADQSSNLSNYYTALRQVTEALGNQQAKVTG